MSSHLGFVIVLFIKPAWKSYIQPSFMICNVSIIQRIPASLKLCRANHHHVWVRTLPPCETFLYEEDVSPSGLHCWWGTHKCVLWGRGPSWKKHDWVFQCSRCVLRKKSSEELILTTQVLWETVHHLRKFVDFRGEDGEGRSMVVHTPWFSQNLPFWVVRALISQSWAFTICDSWVL